MQSQCWRVATLPGGVFRADDFRLDRDELPPLAPGQVQVKVLYLSLDPTNRVWLQGRDTYMPGMKVGEVMRGLAIGRVTDSRHPDFQVGAHVSGLLGWQDHAVVDGAGLTALPSPDVVPLTAQFGLLGHIGLTAHYGLIAIGKPRPGETVVVSTAAGAVGSLVVQIARILGCRVVGIAGSPDKCAWVVDELHADACIDYRRDDLDQALARHCPGGVDIYFDNVGGVTLDTVMGRMNDYGRIVACGMISEYDADKRRFTGHHMLDIVLKRLLVQGFVCLDHGSHAPVAFADLLKWHSEGKLIYRVDEVEGLENAAAALTRLFDGTNRGKLLIKLAD